MVSIPFQELKANGDGNFDGGVKRKTEKTGWERQAGSQGSPSHIYRAS